MFIPKYIKLKNFISFKDQEFQFRNNEAVLIQGKNLDDSSQKGNGSGKSSLIEGVAVAFSGTSIRDVIVKDLIFNDEKSSEIELYLENPTFNRNLKIWRKFYSNTKSAECRVWVNDVEKTDLPDINAYNKFIFETLGISKEDFFNFYLITDENGFVPFLKSSDTKKKEIINRFSGADKVDLATPYIEQDSDKKQREIDSVSKEIERLQGQQLLLVEQVASEEQKLLPEKINLAIEAKENIHTQYRLNIKECTQNIEAFNSQKVTKNAEISSFEKTDFDTQLSLLKDQKIKSQDDLSNLKIELGACKDKFTAEIDQIRKDEQLIISDKAAIRTSINEYQQFIDDVNNKLAGSITCPSCGHVFSLKDKTFNVKEAKEQLPEAEKELLLLKDQLEQFAEKEKDIETQKQDVNKKILAEQEGVKSKIYQNSVEVTAIDKSILEISNKQREEEAKLKEMQFAITQLDRSIKNQEDEITSIESKIQSLKREIDLLRNIDRTKIDELELKTIELITKEEELNAQLEKLTEEKKNIDAWAINFKNFKSHLANKSLKNICDFTNMYLVEMGSNISIEIEGYRMLSNKKLKEEISTIVKKDGFPIGSYGKFSKGERGRVDICTILANKSLINLNSPTGGLDLTLIDEILDAVDTYGLECIINSCQALDSTIMIVSQNDINSLPKHTMIIQKENKVSKIVV